MHSRRIGLVFTAAVLTAGQLFAQSDPCLRRTIAVNVLTDQGKVVSDLATDNFKVSFDHKPAQVLSVTFDVLPRRVMIVLDASGSMIAEQSDWDFDLR